MNFLKNYLLGSYGGSRVKKIRWGIMSAANIAYDELVPALRRSKYAEVVAIASNSIEKTERFNIPIVYSDYMELLNDSSIDAVYIPLPNALHTEWAVKAMDKGKNVLLEKPAALTRDGMLEIKEAAERNQVVFMEAFMYQFHKQHQRVQELLSANLIGESKHLKAHFSWELEDKNDIRLNAELGGGAMRDVGCYGLHAVTQLLAFEPVELSMSGNVLEQFGVDITSVCVLKDAEQRIAEVTASMEMPFLNRYEIIGTKGSLTLDSSFRPDVSDDQFGKITVKDENGNVVLFERIKDDQYLNQIEHFQDCIFKNKKTIYNEEDSLNLATYLEVAYQSLEENSKMIKIP